MPLTQADIDHAVAARDRYEQRFRIEALAAMQRGEALNPEDIRAAFDMLDDPLPEHETLVQECIDRIRLYDITARLKS